MSPDNKSLGQHEAPEQFPTQEEIKSVFETILKGKPYKELKELQVLSDEKGVCRYDIEVTFENGEKIEYNYQKATNDYRDKSLSAAAQFSASIHTIEYGSDGVPCGGTTAANYLDGRWEYIS